MPLVVFAFVSAGGALGLGEGGEGATEARLAGGDASSGCGLLMGSADCGELEETAAGETSASKACDLVDFSLTRMRDVRTSLGSFTSTAIMSMFDHKSTGAGGSGASQSIISAKKEKIHATTNSGAGALTNVSAISKPKRIKLNSVIMRGLTMRPATCYNT